MRKTLLVCLFVGSLAIFSMMFPAPVHAGVSLNPTAVSFGSVPVSTTSSSAIITISNGGHQSVSIVQITSSLPEFVVSGPALPLTLAPHGSAYFHAIFAPDAALTYNGTIAVTTNPQNGNVRTISVSGTGTAAQLAPSQTYLLSPSASSLNFPATLVGTSSSQAISLANTGTGSVTISQISSTGAGFSVSGFSGSVTLAAGQSLSLSVNFSPATVGSVAGSLAVVSTATNSPATIVLSGSGIQPQISVTPASTNFGNVILGSAGTQTLTVSNPGTANLSVTQALLSGTGFSLSGLTLPLNVPPGGSTSFSVKFAPASAGTFSGNLTLTNNSPNSSSAVALVGTGVSSTLQISASPTSLGFGNLTTGTSATQSVILTNAGNSALTLSQDTLTGSGFSVTGLALPLTLSAGQSTSISVAFAPTTTGNFSGTISVTSNATNSPATITLSGTGVQPQISVIPASTSFGNVSVGSTGSQTLTISNPGTASLSLTQALLSGTGFSISGLALPLSVPPGGTSSFAVSFAPASAGSFSGNLTLVNNSPNSPFVVALSGTGVTPTLQLSASPTSLSFGSLTTGTSATQTVALTNTGNSSVSLSQDTLTGVGFSLTGLALPLTLSAGQSTAFSVVFAPTTTGNFSGTVTVTSNAANSPTTVSLSGSGTAPLSHTANLSWTPSSTSFAGFNIYRGGTSGGPYARTNAVLVPTSAFTDTSVVSGQTYYYVATQVDTTGAESAYSNETVAAIP